MQASPLAALHDVMPPSEVSWWPLSAAMWSVIVVSLLLLVTLIVWRYKAWQRQRAKREAIKHSEHITQDPQQLHILVKRLTKHYYGSRAVSGCNKQWAKRLSQLSGQRFDAKELDSLYSPAPDIELANKLHIAIKKFKLKEAIDV